MPVTAELDELFVAAVNAGAKKIMLPEDSRNDYEKLKTDLKNELTIKCWHGLFYACKIPAASQMCWQVN